MSTIGTPTHGTAVTTRRVLLAAFSAASLFPALSFAQADANDEPRESTLRTSLTPTFEHVFDTDLRDSQGSVQVNRAGLELSVSGTIPPDLLPRTRWSVSLDYEASWYNFNNTPDLIPSGANPFQEVHQIDITPMIVHSIDEQWTVLGGAIVRFAGERDADVGDAATYGGFAGARYALSEDFALSFGLRAMSLLEADMSFFPFIGFEWTINEQLSLSSKGPGLALEAKVSDAISARLFGAFESRDYRMAEDSEIPEGVMRDRRARVGLGLDWRFWSGDRATGTLTLETGLDVYQRYYFDDADGNRVGADRTKPAPFVGLSGTFAF